MLILFSFLSLWKEKLHAAHVYHYYLSILLLFLRLKEEFTDLLCQRLMGREIIFYNEKKGKTFDRRARREEKLKTCSTT